MRCAVRHLRGADHAGVDVVHILSPVFILKSDTGFSGMDLVGDSRADHERHTGLVNRCFRSFFCEPATSAILTATLRLIRSSR